jgi:uncharacterized membrane protein/osmotically-inducible protein OsmY
MMYKGLIYGWAINRFLNSGRRSGWGRAKQNTGLTLLSGLGLGAGLMYLFDPNRGNRRRAELQHQLTHAAHKSGDAIGTTARDVGNRARGLWSQIASWFKSDEADDQVIEARVRSKLGRVISHPSAIEVRAEQGHVTLSGPILAREVDALISCVLRVKGVRGVENQLEIHEQAGNLADLQGGSLRESRFELMQENWSPTARLLTSVGGGTLIAYGLNRRGWLGTGLTLCGAGLLARGATNLELKRLSGVGAGRRAVTFQKTFHVNAPVERVFEFWSNFENFPRFMSNVREVRNQADGRSHWTVAGPAGVPVSWEAVVTGFEPNRVIAWKSVPGSTIANSGIVRFEPANGGTRVDIKLAYNPPAGAVGHAVAKLFGADPKSEIDADMVRFKTLLETGHPARDAANRQAGDRQDVPLTRTTAPR